MMGKALLRDERGLHGAVKQGISLLVAEAHLRNGTLAA